MRFRYGLWIVLIGVAALCGSASGDQFAHWHTLSAEELKKELEKELGKEFGKEFGTHSTGGQSQWSAEKSTESRHVILQLIYARAIGRQDMAKAIAQLQAMQPTIVAQEAKIYWHSILCTLHLQSGDLASARPRCDWLWDVLPDVGALRLAEDTAETTITRASPKLGEKEPDESAAARNQAAAKNQAAAIPLPVSADQIHPSILSIAYGALGAYVTRQGHAVPALTLLDMALEQAVRANDRYLLATMHHNRALPLSMLDMTDLAIASLETSRRYKDAVPEDSQLQAILLHNLGFIQALRGGHEDAIEQYRKVIDWAISFDQLSRAYIAVTQLAHSLTALGRGQEAISELQPWVERNNFPRTADAHVDALHALGAAYLSLGQLEPAEFYLQRGLSLATEEQNPVRQQQLTLAWVELLIESDQNERAVAELTALLETAAAGSAQRVQTLQLLSRAHEKLHDYYSAWQYLQQYQVELNETRIQDFDQRLSALRAASDLDFANFELAMAREKELQAQQASKQDRINRNVVILASILIGAIGLLLFRRSLELREAQAHVQLNEQLQATVAQRTEEIESQMSLRIAAEQARASLEKRVAEDERLRTIGQLTGGVAHDFNNLLTVILLSADLLKSCSEEDRDALLEDITHAGESGRATTQSLLAYARQQELQPEALELGAFLRERTSLFQRTLGGAIDLRVITPDEPAVVTADVGQLTTCLINLLFNARDAMGERGMVEIRLALVGSQWVEVTVSDTGPGLTPEVKSHATEPFFTTKQNGGGSGLGLSMVYGFMKQSGGELVVRSKLAPNDHLQSGFGASISLRFARRAQASVSKVVSVDLEDPDLSGRTALLVEDQEGVREVCRVALTRLGFTVLEAQTGAHAQRILAAGDPIDLVITDVQLPGGLSGLDIVDDVAMRYAEGAVPVILMSGGPVEPPAHCAFLMKPFSLFELDATVRRLMQETPLSSLSQGSNLR